MPSKKNSKASTATGAPNSKDPAGRILAAVGDEVDQQSAVTAQLPEIALVYAGMRQLQSTLKTLPADSKSQATVVAQLAVIDNILKGNAPLSNLGGVLAQLYVLRQSLNQQGQQWLSSNAADPQTTAALDTSMLDLISRVRQLLSARPDVSAIMDDLSAIKSLRGGPADAVAYHDFHVLQMATKSVWLHAFDARLGTAVEQLYEQLVEGDPQISVAVPAMDSIEDVTQLKELITGLEGTVTQLGSQPVPPEVSSAFPGCDAQWVMLSPSQQSQLISICNSLQYGWTPDVVKWLRDSGQTILKSPAGPVDRLSKLILEIGQALNEPYAFDVYGHLTYNYGLLITYRQRWEPLEYQAGDLAATISLAPGETRKFSRKRVVKEAVSKKVAERSSSLRSLQSSEDSRAEADIMERATSATNFKMTSSGSFNIGIGSMNVTNEFGGNTENFSSANKKAFHEATMKAAEEYRLERSMEVDTSTTTETEETYSGEISNPNNEITVTYLFYELQRRFRIHEFLYRVQPVILVAQDVPAPHEIDEAWLVQYQWILARVLLDESFRSALNYLTSGFAGDEVSIDVLRASWEKQRDVVDSLEALTKTQQDTRDALREAIVQDTFQKDVLENQTHGLGLFNTLKQSLQTSPPDFTFGSILQKEMSADTIEANRRAAESRLKYVEQSLADAQAKLSDATRAFEAATKEYTAAMQNKYTRHLAIDQLRVHVKQNILYYMQAIWAHEVPDQRYLRLHKMPVVCPTTVPVFDAKITQISHLLGTVDVQFTSVASPLGGGAVGGAQQELAEVADLDNPLGYKANYIIYPLLENCSFTDYLLTDFVDSYLGLKDPDSSAPSNFDPELFDQQWQAAANDSNAQAILRKILLDYLKAVRQATDEIIVPTGQLFIEALPGSHPLLEDFKLLHRMEDVRKAKSEVRQSELENLRLAARLVQGQTHSELLADPKVDKKIVVEGTQSSVLADG